MPYPDSSAAPELSTRRPVHEWESTRCTCGHTLDGNTLDARLRAYTEHVIADTREQIARDIEHGHGYNSPHYDFHEEYVGECLQVADAARVARGDA